MSALWLFCQKHCKKDQSRKRAFLFLNIVLFGLIGFVFWAVLRQWVLKGWDWAAVFTGFAGYFGGFLGGSLYLYNH